MLKVAIIDSGVNNCKKGVSICEDENASVKYLDHSFDFDLLTHGDVVFQTISGNENIEFYSVKIFHNELFTTCKVLCAAIDWCIKTKVNIINISAGLETSDPNEIDSISKICQKAYDANIIIVSAYDNKYSLPAKLSTVIGVEMNTNLLPGEYNLNPSGRFCIDGEVEYINKAQRARGGLNGSSFACAKIVNILINILENVDVFTFTDVKEQLIKNIRFGVRSDVEYLETGKTALFFLNNTNNCFLKYSQNISFNIKTIFTVPIFSNDALHDHNYEYRQIGLRDVFNFNNKFKEALFDLDTIVVSNLEFLNTLIDNFEKQFVDLLLNLSKMKKNVVCLSDLPQKTKESLAHTFRKNKCFISFSREIRTNRNDVFPLETINKTLLLASTRIIDSVKLVTHIKNKYNDCLILSTDKNSNLIGAKTINSIYRNQFINFDMNKNLLKANIVEYIKNRNSHNVFLSIEYPLMQLNQKETRNSEYLSFLSLILAFECDSIVLIVNSRDSVMDIVNTVNAIELITAKKVSEIYISDRCYMEQDNQGYTLYASIPNDVSIMNKQIKDLARLLPDIILSKI